LISAVDTAWLSSFLLSVLYRLIHKTTKNRPSQLAYGKVFIVVSV